MRRRAIVVFVALSFGLSWLLWAPLVFARALTLSLRLPDWYNFLGSLGPLAGALAALPVRGEASGRTGDGSAESDGWRRGLEPWLRERWLNPSLPVAWLVTLGGLGAALILAVLVEYVLSGG